MRKDKGSHAAHTLAGRNHCACGQPAFRKKVGSWICDRCLEIERRYYNEAGHYGKVGFRRTGV